MFFIIFPFFLNAKTFYIIENLKSTFFGTFQEFPIFEKENTTLRFVLSCSLKLPMALETIRNKCYFDFSNPQFTTLWIGQIYSWSQKPGLPVLT